MMSASDRQWPLHFFRLRVLDPTRDYPGCPEPRGLDRGAADVFRVVSGTKHLPRYAGQTSATGPFQRR
ncbi:MAG: hypothetical protein ABJN75_13890, partial [Hoeflea sp.]|uniref:hypothetical protein n=1 Tax=Hoeflea sp. TaxID=1940281 RepID=UPI003298F303